MTGSLRVTSIALATCLAAAAFNVSGTAFAQTPDVAGPVREYQREQPASAPAPRVLRNGVTNYGVGGVAPRFIVEAVSFKAVDESGRDIPYTSDEVFAEFQAGGNFMMTPNFHQVDTGDTETFEAHLSCIWPAIDPDGQRNSRWACAPQGGAGPIHFSIALLEDDNELSYPFRFCFGGGGDLSSCSPRTGQNDVLFEHSFSYEVSDVLQRLDPSCRCLVQTAREAVDSLTAYEVTFRITRVDNAAQQPGMATFEDDPVLHRSGSLGARYNFAFDFDAGTVAATGDLLFSRSGGQDRLTPSGGAKIWPGNASARGYAACFAERMSANYVTTASVLPAIGTHACYVTSDGRVGELRIVSLVPSTFGGSPLLTVSYTTWQ